MLLQPLKTAFGASARNMGMARLGSVSARPFVSSNVSKRTLVGHASAYENTETVELAWDVQEVPNPTRTPLVFMHGLFGHKANHHTVSKKLAADLNCNVYGLDLRNHGQSPHNPRHDYIALASDVERWINEVMGGKEVILIGHSMGAKTAMAVALRHPELVKYLIPVDNSPVDTSLSSDFPKYIRGMMEIQHKKVKNSKEAQDIFKKYEPDQMIRYFLLNNLRRTDDPDEPMKFRVPVEILGKSLGYLGDWPFFSEDVRFTKPTLFIRGTKSKYVADEFMPAIGQFFPNFEIKDIDCGHWVISQKPEEFMRDVREFVEKHDDKAAEEAKLDS
ncbi:Abhydrolase domain-containing protein [Yarrowia sp. E02]|nr:Abhydrolase domain-containing protein [Yarrowia sp. E02]